MISKCITNSRNRQLISRKVEAGLRHSHNRFHPHRSLLCKYSCVFRDSQNKYIEKNNTPQIFREARIPFSRKWKRISFVCSIPLQLLFSLHDFSPATRNPRLCISNVPELIAPRYIFVRRLCIFSFRLSPIEFTGRALR